MDSFQHFQFAARQTFGHREGLSSFLSRLSIAGLVLGVALLIAVLSVMNGFEREMRERILGLLPHVTIRGYAEDETWARIFEILEEDERIANWTPFFDVDALIIHGSDVAATRVLGLNENGLGKYRGFFAPEVSQISSGAIVLGRSLAAKLNLQLGDTVTLLAPSGGNSERKTDPKLFTLESILNTGTELDEHFALVSQANAQHLTESSKPFNGVALSLHDLFRARGLRRDLTMALPQNFFLSDWQLTQGNLYSAIKMSKDMVSLLLLSIIAVAAFNVVASLVLVVTDRRGAIAILRSIGATQSDIKRIFLLQGAIIGVIGAGVGSLLGALFAVVAPSALVAIESSLGVHLLNTDVYPLDFLPVSLEVADILTVAITAFVLSVIASFIPASRAAKTEIVAGLSADAQD